MPVSRSILPSATDLGVDEYRQVANMTEHNAIAQLGADVLRQQALPVDDFDCPEFRTTLAAMQRLMMAGNGVGIAAPQVHHARQIIIVASRPGSRYPHAPLMAPLVMVNPVYQVIDATVVTDWEGCLSVPGIRARVPRYQSVEVSFQNESGEHCQCVLDGFPARVFQHEYDHLLGLVFLDRVESNRDIIAETEFLKQREQA